MHLQYLVQLYRIQQGGGNQSNTAPSPSPEFRQTQNAQQVPSPMGVMPSGQSNDDNKSFEDKVMDTLIKALEKRKAKVSLIKKDYKNITCVSISDVALEIDLYEKFNIIKKGEDRLGFNLYDYIPNGKLVLRIKNAAYGTRREWIDRQRKKVEDRIDNFIEGMFQSVAREKELQKEREA